MGDEEEVKDDTLVNIDDDTFEEVAPVGDDINLAAEISPDEDMESDFMTDDERDGMY
jgi:hypothetical protein